MAKQMKDAAQDYAWGQDRELCELEATMPISIPFKDYERLFAMELRQEPKGCLRFRIETSNGEHIGNCMCYQMDEGKGEAEIGILIGNRAYWDDGYGVEAIELLLEQVFTTTSLCRMYLHTLTSNHRAQRCFAKCGFMSCKEEPRWGRRFLVMELDRNKWQERYKKDPPS
ncbi:MAG: GNAT family N-acetyltransferase [Dehalococcoidia bacterium]|jgi:RimJ/RimL family protein N-acetyltransferase|nr:GNAT family N-acetyltransferase [Dehalococcoidia bacterium]